MERPDQPRFDHFSRHFEEIDAHLEDFGRQNGWELIKNPFRQPARELCKVSQARMLVSIYLEGNWQELDLDAPFLHTAGVTVIYDPVPNLRFFKSRDFVEHASFEYIKANLDQFLHRATENVQEFRLPTKTADGCYIVPEEWCVVTAETLMNRQEKSSS